MYSGPTSLVLGAQSQSQLHPNARKRCGLCCFGQWRQTQLWNAGSFEWSQCLGKRRSKLTNLHNSSFKGPMSECNWSCITNSLAWVSVSQANSVLLLLALQSVVPETLMSLCGISGCSWQLGMFCNINSYYLHCASIQSKLQQNEGETESIYQQLHWLES